MIQGWMSFDFPRTAFVEAILRELQSESTSVLLVGAPRGAGKTEFLKRFARAWRRRGPIALAQLEPVSASPEILHRELARIAGPALGRPRGAAASISFSFEGLLDAIRRRPDDSLLLLDDVTELRTLSYYPSVEAPLESFLEALKKTGKALLTSRFSYWMEWKHPALPLRPLPPLSAQELEEAGVPQAPVVSRVTAGLAVHAARLAECMEASSAPLPVEEALLTELSTGGRIEAECRATLAELLHRARGYGACKSVLHVLAGEEGLKLTEVARRLDRTAGSTRDYLRWLEEVDLVVAREKRFFFVDPLLRLWMRVYGRGAPPTEDDLRREIESCWKELFPAGSPREQQVDRSFTLPPPPKGDEDLVEID